jgi:hypothetical protein
VALSFKTVDFDDQLEAFRQERRDILQSKVRTGFGKVTHGTWYRSMVAGDHDEAAFEDPMPRRRTLVSLADVCARTGHGTPVIETT